MTKKSRQKFKCLKNKESYLGEIKSIFKGLSVAQNCLRPENASLKRKLCRRKNGLCSKFIYILMLPLVKET